MPPELIRRFAEETDVFGLHLFRIRRTTCETVFWCLLVALSICYTTKSLIDLTWKYADEEIVTVVEQKFEKKLTIPYTQICFYGNSVAESSSIESALEGIKSWELERINTGPFISVSNFLLQLQLVESQIQLRRPEGELTRTEFEFDGKTLSGLRKFLASSNTTISEVSEMLFRKICQSLELNISFFDYAHKTQKKPKPICDLGYPRFASLDGDYAFTMCADVDTSQDVFDHSFDRLDVEFDTSKALERFGIDIAEVYFALDDVDSIFETLNSEIGSSFGISTGKRQANYVRISAIYEKANLRRRRCMKDPNEGIWCRHLCESRFFFDSYGCWPLVFMYQFSTFRQNLSAERVCSAQDYLSFTEKAIPEKSARKRVGCLLNCAPPCTEAVYSAESNELGLAKNQRTGSASIYIQSHRYPLFEQRLARDFEDFLCNFGGALGLLLGTSCASLVHIPLFLLQAAVAYLRKKMNWKKSRGENENVDVEMQTVDEETSLSRQRLDALEAKQNAKIDALRRQIEILAEKTVEL